MSNPSAPRQLHVKRIVTITGGLVILVCILLGITVINLTQQQTKVADQLAAIKNPYGIFQQQVAITRTLHQLLPAGVKTSTWTADTTYIRDNINDDPTRYTTITTDTIIRYLNKPALIDQINSSIAKTGLACTRTYTGKMLTALHCTDRVNDLRVTSIRKVQVSGTSVGTFFVLTRTVHVPKR